MKSGNKSRIETSPDTGRKSLIVFYDSETDDFNEAIERAVVLHKIERGKISVIAIPKNMKGEFN
jgi:hypothetical protein